MPTTRPRHLITETDEVAQALDDAAQRWPDEPSRARLLLRLLAEGHRVVVAQRAAQMRRRRDAVGRTAGVLTDVYGPGYLAELRADWPE
ncbi:hypothetical protein [Intrasporangium sp.]|uniref:hypothetical protein n=1 Tax=Intrasporangium sp. TaxID=1925024 RepID=UPI003222124F